MRLLSVEEIGLVAGAGECASGGNNLGGVTQSTSFGQDVINIYEGAVDAMSHIIERVADAL